jgi:hypothetical protein
MTVDYEEDRDFPPLYHYCDTNAFKSIVEHSELWLSSLGQSNDSMEGKLPYFLIKNVLSELNLGEKTDDRIMDMWFNLTANVDCCAVCFSSGDDLLSQWRGYAADGSGFSIGFGPAELNRLQVPGQEAFRGWHGQPRLYYVAYNEDEQRSHFKNLINDMLPHLKVLTKGTTLRTALLPEQSNSSQEALRAMGNTMFRWLPSAYTVKGPAFIEEHEARLVVVSPLFPTVHRYRTRGSSLIPYIPLPIPPGGTSPIVSVRLGPTNPTPIQVVEGFLEANELGHVQVLRSKASYRG